MNLVELSNFFHQTKINIYGYCSVWDGELRTVVERNLMQGKFKPGYRDGVILVPVPANISIRSRVVSVDADTTFVTICESRVPGETPRKKTMALVPEIPIARYLTAVLYRSDVLEEDNDRSTDAEWELVTLLAQVDEEEPIAPTILMSNHFKADGGTDTKMDAVAFESALRTSYDYWKNRALGITEEEWKKYDQRTNRTTGGRLDNA